MANNNDFDQFRGSGDYVTSEPLRNAVNVSIALKRPLLIRGEPGTGKTLLAHSIARGLDKQLIIWNVKSTTKAQEGLFVYDTVQRLNDSRFGDRDVSDITQYIKDGSNKIAIHLETDRIDGGLVNPLYLAGDFGVELDPVKLVDFCPAGDFE